jgi:regulator of nucleoside diphosphate kinase
MKRKIVVTVSDYNKLMELIEFTSLQTNMPDITSRLQETLSAARMLSSDQIDQEVITMNSRVRLKGLASKREVELTVTYPEDAEPRERRVSVFSEIGTALLGRKEKEIVYWKVPDGVGAFKIVEVTYQPEAAGDYYL